MKFGYKGSETKLTVSSLKKKTKPHKSLTKQKQKQKINYLMGKYKTIHKFLA